MGLALVPVTPVTGSDDPAKQISVGEVNGGTFFKFTQTAAGVWGKGASGDSVILTLGAGLSISGTTLSAPGALDGTHIKGLLVTKHTGANTLDIGAGEAYVPAASAVVAYAGSGGSPVSIGSPVTGSGVTKNQVFLDGSAVIHVVNNVDPPNSTYLGTARKDVNNYRWLGEVKTDNAGNVIDEAMTEYAHGLVLVSPKARTDLSPFRLVSGLNTTTWTVLDCSPAVPKYATSEVLFFFQGIVASGGTEDNIAIRFAIDAALAGTTTPNINASANAYCRNTFLGGASIWTPIIPQTTTVYYMDIATLGTTPAVYVDTFGYKFAR
jgi:hypothetical protein